MLDGLTAPKFEEVPDRPAGAAIPVADPRPPLAAGRRRWALGTRLAAAYGVLALLAVGAVGATVWSGSRLLAEREEALAVGEVARLADRVAAVLDRAEETAAVLAASLPTDPAACTAALEAASAARPALAGRTTLVGPDRHIACADFRAPLGAPLGATVAATATLATAERTARPAGPSLLVAPGGEPVLLLAHPVRRGSRSLGVLLTELPVAALREGVGGWDAATARGLWLLEAGGTSAALHEAGAPVPAFDADPLFGPEPARMSRMVVRAAEGLLVGQRVDDDLVLLAAIPPDAFRPPLPPEVLAPPLALAALLLAGLAALFWAVGRFVLGPLEAATRRLEAPGAILPDTREARAPAEIAQLIERLGAARATREEAVQLRDLLLREVNHRIKNHLALVASFLRLQERRLSDHAALQALRTAEGRMRSIALTYELLHEGADDQVALDRMLDRTAKALTARDAAGGPVIETELEPVSVPADVAVKVGLVVNELATNSLKHAFVGQPPGTVRITLRQRGAGFVLRISDDGAGMPPGARRNLGMTVVDNLSRAIGAAVERLPGPGTAHQLTWQPNGGRRPRDPRKPAPRRVRFGPADPWMCGPARQPA
ncbi:sensor histidine kinase [Roseomonas sp. CCTCC AB2023176]|uniref:sensor histidine kinase n=1 Tax=Roseomonas sp. CCTCC AB2023176 TaxID=3342640 RepID=UPI0035DFCA5D